MSSAQGIVHHFADFHDAPWISSVLAVDRNAEDDVIILQPGSTFGAAHLGIVRSGDAVARLISCVVGAVVDLHPAPGDVPPVDIALNKDLFPARHKAGEDGAFGVEIARRCRNVPCDEMIGYYSPVVLLNLTDPQQTGRNIGKEHTESRVMDETHKVADNPGDPGVYRDKYQFEGCTLFRSPSSLNDTVDEGYLHSGFQLFGERPLRYRWGHTELLDYMVR